MELSGPQQEAVSHFNGPCLCIAGPGSGKTLVLTERIGHLIEKRGVAPENILVVTFTRDAAVSMQKRFVSGHSPASLPAFGTFHSIFFNILKREGLISDHSIVSGRKAAALLSFAVKEHGIRPKDQTFYPKLIRTVSYYKNCGHLSNDSLPPDMTAETVMAVIGSYQRVMREAGLFDLDDLLVRTKSFFTEHPDRLDFWRGRFKYILVDEAQDMNALQYQIIGDLSRKRQNLFIVGDDDQAIYGFRGSDPSFLLSFTEDYPDAHTIILACNYRSDRAIVEASSRLISNNKRRFEKRLLADSEQEGLLHVITAKDEREEAGQVCDMIEDLLAKGEPEGEIAVLYRNRRIADSLMIELEKRGMIKGGGSLSLYKSFVYRDIISILRSSDRYVSCEDFIRALSHPDRNLGRIGLSGDMVDRKSWLCLMRNTILCDEADKFSRELDFISGLSPYAAIDYILRRMSYSTYICDYTRSKGLDQAMYMEHARRLKEAAFSHHRIGDFVRAMEEKRKMEEREASKTKRSCGIGLYTFHGSKGLEFDHVFIIGAVMGITPSDKADTAVKLEEERRMFYVAMTRAKRQLIISLSAKYGNHSYYPSPFIREALD